MAQGLGSSISFPGWAEFPPRTCPRSPPLNPGVKFSFECFAASIDENKLTRFTEMNSTSLTVPFSADKRSYRLLFVPFLTLSCFDNPVLIFLGVAGTLWQTWKNKIYPIFLLLSPLLSTFGIVTLFLIFLKVWLHAASLYFLNSLLLSSILLHIICVLEMIDWCDWNSPKLQVYW